MLVSSLPADKAQLVKKALKDGQVDIVIGTHALIQQDVAFKSLAFVAIDEQHKFGVSQRALLPKKGIPNPHCLVMSATPIPRSLALSIYGDLDLSVIKVMPKGRQQPDNIWFDEAQRPKAYQCLKEQLSAGRQAYIVYPAIDEGEDDLMALEAAYDNMSSELKDFKVGIFHGQMKSDDKKRVIEDFRAGLVHALLCTTVVEVGVNVPNASVMIVENPERFGLSQLHQLRGRIKRSTHKPYFIMIAKDDISVKARERLKAIVESDDGFTIAEKDLLLRGPGDLFGHSQHGLPALQIADPLRDIEALIGAFLGAGSYC